MDFVAQARGLNTTSKITLSQNEFNDYPEGSLYSPVDNTVIQTPDGQDYVFLNGAKHPASAFVIKQRGLATSTTALSVNTSDASLFPTATVLPPADDRLSWDNQASNLFGAKWENRIIQLLYFCPKQYQDKTDCDYSRR